MLLSVIPGCRLYWSAWGVISVIVDFEGVNVQYARSTHRSLVAPSGSTWNGFR